MQIGAMNGTLRQASLDPLQRFLPPRQFQALKKRQALGKSTSRWQATWAMSQGIPEADWRVISTKLMPLALDRYCTLVLAEVNALIAADRPSHDRYRDLYQLIKRRDRELAEAFNDLRRSTAMMQLLRIWSLGLLEQSELNPLTDETRQWLLEISSSMLRK